MLMEFTEAIKEGFIEAKETGIYGFYRPLSYSKGRSLYLETARAIGASFYMYFDPLIRAKNYISKRNKTTKN